MNLARTYLDYNASAPLTAKAQEALLIAIQESGNPSSVHFEGRNARKMVEAARNQLCAALGVTQNQVVFTSGATEAAMMALSPSIRAGGKEIKLSKLFVGATEHPCILSGGRFSPEQIETLPVFESGLLDLNALEKQLAEHDPSTGAAMVSVMLANNETGIIQPISKIAELTSQYDAFLTVDAVQALGKIDFDFPALGAHFVILSSHKIGGPKGAGALILGSSSISPSQMFKGGGQENFQRAGTENTAAIAGFGVAVSEIAKNLPLRPKVSGLRDLIETDIRTICMDAGNKAGVPVFFSSAEERLPNTSCFAIPGVKAETALISLDLAGISVSSGSACSSGKVKSSHVLKAMGIDDDLAECALRISTGYDTNNEDAEKFLGELKNIVNRIG